jgi:hypothetical protein
MLLIENTFMNKQKDAVIFIKRECTCKGDLIPFKIKRKEFIK